MVIYRSLTVTVNTALLKLLFYPFTTQSSSHTGTTSTNSNLYFQLKSVQLHQHVIGYLLVLTGGQRTRYRPI